MVSVSAAAYPASRTPIDDSWARWAKGVLEEATDRRVVVLPNIGGTVPNDVFTGTLSVSLLTPIRGWLQHAPDEHMLASIARDGPRAGGRVVPFPRQSVRGAPAALRRPDNALRPDTRGATLPA